MKGNNNHGRRGGLTTKGGVTHQSNAVNVHKTMNHLGARAGITGKGKIANQKHVC